MDCGAQLRLAWAQSTIEQGLRVLRAELRDTHRNRRNTPYAQPPRSGMRLFKHALSGVDISAHGDDTLRLICVVRDWLRTYLEPSEGIPGGEYVFGRYKQFL